MTPLRFCRNFLTKCREHGCRKVLRASRRLELYFPLKYLSRGSYAVLLGLVLTSLSGLKVGKTHSLCKSKGHLQTLRALDAGLKTEANQSSASASSRCHHTSPQHTFTRSKRTGLESIHSQVRGPPKGPEKWCRAKIVEKCRKTFDTFWRFLTFSALRENCRKLSKNFLTLFDDFWRGPFPPAPFAIRWSSSLDFSSLDNSCTSDGERVTTYSVLTGLKARRGALNIRWAMLEPAGVRQLGDQQDTASITYMLQMGTGLPALSRERQTWAEGGCPCCCIPCRARWTFQLVSIFWPNHGDSPTAQRDGTSPRQWQCRDSLAVCKWYLSRHCSPRPSV